MKDFTKPGTTPFEAKLRHENSIHITYIHYCTFQGPFCLFLFPTFFPRFLSFFALLFLLLAVRPKMATDHNTAPPRLNLHDENIKANCQPRKYKNQMIHILYDTNTRACKLNA